MAHGELFMTLGRLVTLILRFPPTNSFAFGCEHATVEVTTDTRANPFAFSNNWLGVTHFDAS